MKHLIWIWVLFSLSATAQDSTILTLEQCQQLARQNYPLLKQQQVLNNILKIQTQNINSSWLPQAVLNGQASYQSDVVQLPIKLPGLNITPLAKDQYRATIDVNQQIYDGGITRQQRDLQAIQQQTSQQQVEVELYKVKQQVTQVYFNALLSTEYITTSQLAQKDLQQRLEKLQAGVNNGTVLPSSVDLLQAELLKAQQQEIAAASSKKAYLAVMQLLTGVTLTGVATRTVPDQVTLTETDTLNRPELLLYHLQSNALQQQSLLTGARKLPRVSAFVQGGFGRPGLNMLSNDFAPFYITGVRLNWTLWNWHYQRKEQQVLTLQEKNVDIQSATFTLNTRVQLAQQAAEIEQLQQTLEKDQSIIALRIRVKEAAAAQLDNGVITVHDYVQDLDAETQARISQQTHTLQLALAHINYQLIRGY
ncbi:outer membrane protein TolC [Chitinophaga niastensis]|uniref:Outer membrane protein TolC n=1 Tax=Chitinophaga niastensis TaxID=536980 RepID=A0A2P8HPU7_CHINA|nr:TolC family protein [Chitinophaga niastensis]PSL48253.1 outer membrane protein TolC [Chitinophaga niastensis]